MGLCEHFAGAAIEYYLGKDPETPWAVCSFSLSLPFLSIVNLSVWYMITTVEHFLSPSLLVQDLFLAHYLSEFLGQLHRKHTDILCLRLPSAESCLQINMLWPRMVKESIPTFTTPLGLWSLINHIYASYRYQIACNFSTFLWQMLLLLSLTAS